MTGESSATPNRVSDPRGSTPPPPDEQRAAAALPVTINHERTGPAMLVLVFVVFAIACIMAFVQWWNGPDIPR
jgi:hypothetical protein